MPFPTLVAGLAVPHGTVAVGAARSGAAANGHSVAVLAVALAALLELENLARVAAKDLGGLGVGAGGGGGEGARSEEDGEDGGELPVVGELGVGGEEGMRWRGVQWEGVQCIYILILVCVEVVVVGSMGIEVFVGELVCCWM